MTSYYCRVLRYINNIFTHEFANIGLMMWIPQRELILFDATTRYTRISQFFDNFEGKIYRQRISNLYKSYDRLNSDLNRLRSYKENPSEVFYELLPRDLSSFQWSSPIAGICSIPEQRFDQLFNEYVKVYKTPTYREYDSIWGVVRGELKKHDLVEHVQLDFPMRVADVSWSFKMSWDNGVRQVLEPIPLMYQKSAQIIDKASVWNGRLSFLSKSHDFKCTAVISNAPTDSTTEAYNEAYAILKNARSMRKVITENEMPHYIHEIKKDLHIENR